MFGKIYCTTLKALAGTTKHIYVLVVFFFVCCVPGMRRDLSMFFNFQINHINNSRRWLRVHVLAFRQCGDGGLMCGGGDIDFDFWEPRNMCNAIQLQRRSSLTMIYEIIW